MYLAFDVALGLDLPSGILGWTRLELISLLFDGFGQAFTPMNLLSLITLAVPRDGRGTTLAVRLRGNRVGQVALAQAAGALAGPLGPGAAIWFSVAVLLLPDVEQAVEGTRAHRRKA